MVSVEQMVEEINAYLARSTADRLFAYDDTHFYLFEGGFDNLSRAGLRARRLSFEEFWAFYELSRLASSSSGSATL